MARNSKPHGQVTAILRLARSARTPPAMPSRNLIKLVHLPPDLARHLRSAVDEAFQSLGGATAELILHYARRRHKVYLKGLPQGIEELDEALKEILGTGRRMLVNHCAEVLSRRLGREVRARTDKLSDLFRQVMKIYPRLSSSAGANISSLLGDIENPDRTLLPDNLVE